MTEALLFIFVSLCALLLLSGMMRRGAMYEFPFLAGAVLVGFALPQFLGLSRDPFLPPGALNKTLIVAILAAGMCWLGNAANARPLPWFWWDYNERRLLYGAAVLSLAGAYFYFAISRLPEEMTDATQWTGLPVAYFFFARMLSYGFAIAVLLYARTSSKIALIIAVFGALFYVDRIVFGGRRADAAEFTLILLLGLWFSRHRAIPRPAMLGILVVGILLINSIRDYRDVAADGLALDEVFRIEFVGNFEEIYNEGGYELLNAVYFIEATQRSLTFDLGTFHWNNLVFNYVPAQIFGKDTKDSLIFDLGNVMYEELSYAPHTGTTMTGLADSFGSFWYFGCLEFLAISIIMSKLYLAARAGNITVQLLYMLLITPALHTITHHTSAFLTPWPHMMVFLIPVLWIARTRSRSSGFTALWDRRVPRQGGHWRRQVTDMGTTRAAAREPEVPNVSA